MYLFQSLFQSWVESLLFLKPSNLKLLLLATLRIIRDSYKFFVGILLLFVLFESSLWDIIFGIKSSIFDIIQKILLIDLFFMFVLVARPSVKRKAKDYFGNYAWHFLYWFCIPLVIIPFIEFVLKVSALPPILVAVLFPIEVFWILFWLDVRVSIKNLFLSLWRGLKMLLFNLPFCVIAFIIPYFILVYIRFLLPALLSKYLEVICAIFYICLFTVFYTKRLHDQFKLYFAE